MNKILKNDSQAVVCKVNVSNPQDFHETSQFKSEEVPADMRVVCHVHSTMYNGTVQTLSLFPSFLFDVSSVCGTCDFGCWFWR